MNEKYTESRKFLGRIIKVKIDRIIGSKHPKYGFIYLVNYGFIPHIISTDGDELDAYVLGVFKLVKEFTGECISIIHRTNDNEDKLIVAPKGRKFSDAEIKVLTEFQERFFNSTVKRKLK